MAYTILVVDNSLLARTFMEKALRLSGLPIGEICLACNGREALQVMEERWIDLVLTAINMPEMNGLDLVQTMRAGPALKNLPVVIVSSVRSEARMRELEQLGIKGYVTKPFTPEKLKQIVEGLLPA
ncbi:MAG: response regulator [Kiritimatiellae bacterium]|nr:response regulator [Kiritimatiellia bacterium]